MAEVLTQFEAIDQARVNPEGMSERFDNLFKIHFTESFSTVHHRDDEDADLGLAEAESKNLEVLNQIKSLEEIRNIGEREIRELLDAATGLEYVQNVAAGDVNPDEMKMNDPIDPRMVFRVGGDFWVISPDMFRQENTTPEQARVTLKMELILLCLEQRNRTLETGIKDLEEGNAPVDEIIDRFDTLSNTEKSRLKIARNNSSRYKQFDRTLRRPTTENGIKIKKEIIGKLNNAPTESEAERLAELFQDMIEVDNFEMDLARQEDIERVSFKKEEQEIAETTARIETYRTTMLRDKLRQIAEFDIEDTEKIKKPKVEITKLVHEMTDFSDPENPIGTELGRRLKELARDSQRESVGLVEFKKSALDIVIAYERGVNHPEGFSYEQALPLFSCGENFDLETLEETLSDVDLREFIIEVEANNDLFTGDSLSQTQEVQREKILSRYTKLSKRNLIESGLSGVRLEANPPLDLAVYEGVLNTERPAITDIMPFLSGRELTSACRMLYIRGGIEGFDAKGLPISGNARAERIYNTFLVRAREAAGHNEYKAIAEKTKAGFEASEVGQLVKSAAGKCRETIDKNLQRSWRESPWLAFGAERDRRFEFRRNRRNAQGELVRIERFEKFYLRQSGLYETTANQMKRNIQAELDRIGDRTPTANERRDILKNAGIAYLQHELRSRIIRYRLGRLSGLSSMNESLKEMDPNLFSEKGESEQELRRPETPLFKFSQRIASLEGYKVPDLSHDATEDQKDEIRKEVDKIVKHNLELQTASGRVRGIGEVRVSIYDDLMRAVNGDQELYRNLVNQFNSELGASTLWGAGECQALSEILNNDLRTVVSEGNPAKIMDVLHHTRVNERIQDKVTHRLYTEARRAARRERGRQILEGLVQNLTGIPDARLDNIHSAAQYFEAGEGVTGIGTRTTTVNVHGGGTVNVSIPVIEGSFPVSLYRGTIQTRYRVANTLNAVARGWHASNAVFFEILVNPIIGAPYSERFHDRIDNANDRRAELRSRNTERLRRLQRIYGTDRELFWFPFANPELEELEAGRTTV